MVTLGVTGHRFLVERQRIDAALTAVVERLVREYPEPWAVVSSLADGADQLIAHRLLERPGTRLVVVLPLDMEDYATDFTTSESRAEFRALLARADGIVRMPPQADRERAYEAGELEVLHRSDLLVSAWDGEGEPDVGGASPIVTLAQERGTPVVWVRAGDDSTDATRLSYG